MLQLLLIFVSICFATELKVIEYGGRFSRTDTVKLNDDSGCLHINRANVELLNWCSPVVTQLTLEDEMHWCRVGAGDECFILIKLNNLPESEGYLLLFRNKVGVYNVVGFEQDFGVLFFDDIDSDKNVEIGGYVGQLIKKIKDLKIRKANELKIFDSGYHIIEKTKK